MFLQNFEIFNNFILLHTFLRTVELSSEGIHLCWRVFVQTNHITRSGWLGCFCQQDILPRLLFRSNPPHSFLLCRAR